LAILKNEFSWSKSRAHIFEECLRRYWFHYYGSWGGWDPGNVSAETREIYILKQLKTRWMWAGELVHFGVELALRELQGAQVEMPVARGPEAIKDRILVEMRKDFIRSKNGTYRIDPKTGGLFEHEYQLNLTDEEWQDVKNHILSCLEKFFHSEIFEELKQVPKTSWLPIEKSSAFDFEGTKVYVKPDAFYRTGEGGVKIIDWKTGREDREESSFQLPTYLLYVIEKHRADPEKVLALEVNLSTGTIRQEVFDPEKILKIKEEIRGSIEEMKRYLVESEKNIVRKEDFPVTIDPKICRYCNYQKVCEERPREPE